MKTGSTPPPPPPPSSKNDNPSNNGGGDVQLTEQEIAENFGPLIILACDDSLFDDIG